MMRWFELLLSSSLVLLVATGVVGDTAKQALFEQSAREIDAFDFVEVTIKVAGPTAKNPFRDVAVTGQFQQDNGSPIKAEGFCDCPDGGLYRIRFMPTKPGRYSYTVQFRQGDQQQTHSGKFIAQNGKRRGPVRIDKKHPWHFIWEGTGDHYFWNGTTTYWLLGWQDEDIIWQAIDRLDRLKVNRLRVALCGRTKSGDRWFEPLVVNTDKFQFRLNPWVAERPDSVENPGFDVTRYNVPFWQKCERMLCHAREKGMIISIIFYLDGKDPGVDPFGKRMGNEDEQRYYRYGVARLAAFSNVMWDVANEYRFFRDDAWAEKMGALIKNYDPYQHPTSTHGHGDFRFRTSPWADFAMYQNWDESGGHNFMLKNRQQQAATGRPMPQINEEYGYEDHYPGRWGGGKKAPARSADDRRRLAWGMYMAGGYQTTGERADRGTSRGPDTGGGWINGRGDDQMTMLEGYGHIVTCFTSLRWWKMEPRDDLVSQGNYCLAEPGQQYLVYLPIGGKADVKFDNGTYQAQWFNPRNGKWTAIGGASGPKWTSPNSPDDDDWALVLRRESSDKRPTGQSSPVPTQKAYVPEPQPVATQILVGAHNCPLWEADQPKMWNQVLKHPERTPALGFYSQENPEVADWETKWAVEHGISFFVYCWYRNGQGGPVKMRFGSAIHDALFKSRYVSKMKFTIMWENQARGVAGVSSEADLMDNLLPFWIQEYFRHPSYLKIGNKPLLFIYRPEFLVQDLGGADKVRVAFDKMRAACRIAGFDGLYLLGEYRGLDPKHLELMKRLGLDYTFAYCWHVQGNPNPRQAIAAQLDYINKTQRLGILPQVVTVSQGWSGWHDEGSIWKIPPTQYKELLEKAKAVIGTFPAKELGSRVLLLDNWNEWSEGHYLAPHREYGFGYLDAMREVFSDAPKDHVDLLPKDVGMGPYDQAYQRHVSPRK